MSVLTIAGSPAPGDTGRGAGTPSVVLTVPGLYGSGPEHWQSHWERARPALRRVEQPDWEVPDIDRWAASIAAHLAPGGPPAILVAHSFGCLAAVRFAWQHPGRVRAALLVAPANPGRFDATEALPLQALPFPAILVASRNDPWLSFPKALFWATMWRTQLFDLGYAGHINAESGYGPWPEGLGLLNRVSQLRWRPEHPPGIGGTAPVVARTGALAHNFLRWRRQAPVCEELRCSSRSSFSICWPPSR